MKKKIRIKILDPKIGKSIPLPSYATSGSSGLDLRACLEEPFYLKPNEVRLIKTGISLYISDPKISGIIIPRSGLGHNHGIVLGNLIGLIDSDYHGELIVSLWNRSKEIFKIKPSYRVAQIIFVPTIKVECEFVENFDLSKRGTSGFGHSGY